MEMVDLRIMRLSSVVKLVGRLEETVLLKIALAMASPNAPPTRISPDQTSRCVEFTHGAEEVPGGSDYRAIFIRSNSHHRYQSYDIASADKLSRSHVTYWTVGNIPRR